MQNEPSGAAANTDKEIWREREGDYYADSIHLTETGGIGINCGGTVYVKPLREWHKLAGGTFSRYQSPPNDQPDECAELDNAGMVTTLNRYCEFKGGQKAAADMLGITTQYLCDILQGRMDVSEVVAGKLGYDRIIVYRLHNAPKRESGGCTNCGHPFNGHYASCKWAERESISHETLDEVRGVLQDCFQELPNTLALWDRIEAAISKLDKEQGRRGSDE